jgi:hypothetical protein
VAIDRDHFVLATKFTNGSTAQPRISTALDSQLCPRGQSSYE